jgi:hypothetical protein
MRAPALVVLVLFSACDGSGRGRGEGVGAMPDLLAPGPGPSDAGGSNEQAVVYAHSPRELYSIDPDTLAITLVGSFAFPPGMASETLTDVAVDRSGNLTGISFTNVYRVDARTAACTFLARLDRELNSLSYLTQPGGGEILVAAGKDDGAVYRIDPASGTSTQVGAYGGGLVSSGDLVSVRGFGTVATVRNGSGSDYLARIDEATGQATLIGDTGRVNVWGLGFWKDRVFGFSSLQGFMTIDVKTGKATTVPGGDHITWWGAGVTTSAPVIL